jgi:hypothetical protein
MLPISRFHPTEGVFDTSMVPTHWFDGFYSGVGHIRLLVNAIPSRGNPDHDRALFA